MDNIYENNQEAAASFDPWGEYTDDQLDAMAQDFAERERGRNEMLETLERNTWQDEEPVRKVNGY
jgi:type IV secretory pathway VirD2 relaxase